MDVTRVRRQRQENSTPTVWVKSWRAGEASSGTAATPKPRVNRTRGLSSQAGMGRTRSCAGKSPWTRGSRTSEFPRRETIFQRETKSRAEFHVKLLSRLDLK